MEAMPEVRDPQQVIPSEADAFARDAGVAGSRVISFVVPAHNEEFELPATLAAIQAAASTAGNYEILVVDDDSTDQTTQIAQDAGARVVSVRRRQIAAARNTGAREARGDVIIFVDADTLITAAHVHGALDALRNGYVGGGARMITQNVPRWGRVCMAIFCKLYFAANLGAGAFLFTTRANFAAVGGFDERYFAAEEVYFSQALKKLGRFTILREPAITSGRKLRMHTGRALIAQMWGIMRTGPRAYLSRERLGVWYDGKRETQSSSSL